MAGTGGRSPSFSSGRGQAGAGGSGPPAGQAERARRAGQTRAPRAAAPPHYRRRPSPGGPAPSPSPLRGSPQCQRPMAGPDRTAPAPSPPPPPKCGQPPSATPGAGAEAAPATARGGIEEAPRPDSAGDRPQRPLPAGGLRHFRSPALSGAGGGRGSSPASPLRAGPHRPLPPAARLARFCRPLGQGSCSAAAGVGEAARSSPRGHSAALRPAGEKQHRAAPPLPAGPAAPPRASRAGWHGLRGAAAGGWAAERC